MSTTFTFRSPVKLPDTALPVEDAKTAIPTSRITSVFESDSFTFIVGKDAKKFVLPSQLVASASKVLDRMINGSMKEAQAKLVVWEDVDKDTFIRFCEYLYTAKYHNPGLVELPTENTKGRSKLESLDPSISSPTNGSELTVGHVSPFETNETLFDRGKHRFNFGRLTIGPRQPRPSLVIKDQASADDVEILTAHINVYVFADKYGLSDLCCLAWKKIHGALVTSLDQKNLSLDNIVKLIQIVYHQTAERSSTPGEPLRRLIAAFAVLRVQHLLDHTPFKELQYSCPEAHFDILRELAAINSEWAKRWRDEGLSDSISTLIAHSHPR